MTLAAPLGLDCGATLNAVTIEYESYGRLDSDGGNAILLCHGLSGNAHAASVGQREDAVPGWWDIAIGPGRMLDTDRYFILCSSVIGGAGASTGPATRDPATGRPYGMRFPVVTVADMVRAQAALLDRLGIARLHAVVGGCFGGLQVLAWSALYPHRLAAAIAITVRASTAPYSIALWQVVREAIRADPLWKQGDYYDGPPPQSGAGFAAAISLLQYMDGAVMERKYGRRRTLDVGPQFTFEPEFLVEQMIQQVLSGQAARLDPNGLLYLTRSISYFDFADILERADRSGGRSVPRYLLVSYDRDHRFPVEETDALAETLRTTGASVEHHVLPSNFSHGGYQFEVEDLAPLIDRVLTAPALPRKA